MFKKIILFTLCASVITSIGFMTFAEETFISENESIVPNKQVVSTKVHLNKVKGFRNANEINTYCKNLTIKEHLELLNEMSDEYGERIFTDGINVMGGLNKKVTKESHLSEISKMLTDKSYDKNFRAVLVDLLENKMKRNSIDEITDSMIRIAKDITEEDNLKVYTVSKIRVLSSNDLHRTNQLSQLEEIFNDPNSSPKLKGSVITSMRRVNHPKLDQYIQKSIDISDKTTDELTRHAIVAGVKNRSLMDDSKIKNIADTTQNPKVYRTMIYSLGLLKNKDAIKKIVSMSGKNEKFESQYIVVYAIQSNQSVVSEMLNVNNDKSTVESGIQAAKIATLHSALDNLKKIGEDYPDEKIRKDAMEVYATINSMELPSGGMYGKNYNAEVQK